MEFKIGDRVVTRYRKKYRNDLLDKGTGRIVGFKNGLVKAKFPGIDQAILFYPESLSHVRIKTFEDVINRLVISKAPHSSHTQK